MWVIIDGCCEKVGNFCVELFGLFRGCGEYSKMGKIKRRVVSEDIIINIGKDVKVFEFLVGYLWKVVIYNDIVMWLVGWNDVINVKDWKYV